MSEYERTTKERSFERLRPELIAAIREHVKKRIHEDVESEILICCETTSERKKTGLIGRLMGTSGKTLYTAALVTPRWLIWATSGDRQQATALSARLSEIEVEDYERSSMFKMIEDSGVNMLGFTTGSMERVMVFIGLGKERAAEKLKEVLFERVSPSSAGRTEPHTP
jgi:hypothetical protein